MRVFDPLVSNENIRRMTDAEIGKNIYSTVARADLIACFAAHTHFVQTPLDRLKAKTNPTCWFFDGRHGFDPRHVTNAGFIYTSIGSACYGIESPCQQ